MVDTFAVPFVAEESVYVPAGSPDVPSESVYVPATVVPEMPGGDGGVEPL